MSYEYVVYEKNDHVAVVTINRPLVYNAIHPLATAELCKVWADFRDDPKLWVAILTGAGERAFCAGNDLKYMAAHPEMLHGDIGSAQPSGFGFGGMTQFECFKPIIAALNGLAMGGGLEMALACDIIIAAEHTLLGLPEPTVGLMALGGGVHRLPRMIPQKIAMRMLLTGKPISAEEAHRIGLVNEVVPPQELMQAALRCANEIVACSPLAVQATKQASTAGLCMPVEEAMSHTFTIVDRLLESEDAAEGPRAFAEKRKPMWRGY